MPQGKYTTADLQGHYSQADIERPVAEKPDVTPLEQQGVVRRFATRLMGVPDRMFDHPGEYLNPFSRSYWNPTSQRKADIASMLPSRAPTISEMVPGRQTLGDIDAGNYAGAVGDVLPEALAVAQIAAPGARMGARSLGRVMETNAPKVAEFVAHPVSSTIKPIVRGGIRQAGRILQRMAGPEAAPPASKPLGEIQARGEAKGLSRESLSDLNDRSPQGLTPQSREELRQIMAEPPPGPTKPGMVTSGGTSTGPNWEELTEASNARAVGRAQQMNVSGEGMPAKPSTAESQSWTDAIANFGVPAKMGETQGTGALGNISEYYGKNAGKSNNFGKTGKPTAQFKRDFPKGVTPSPAASGPHPPEIMRILNTPGDIPDADWEILQNYFGTQRKAASAGR